MSSDKNVFTTYIPHPERRIFLETDYYLKAACVNGKLLMTGKPEVIRWAQQRYSGCDGAWFMDFTSLRELDEGMKEFGCRIGQAHPFFIADRKSPVDTKDYEIQIYRGDELEQFRGDPRFSEAFLFKAPPRDEIGVAALRKGMILGMAGATSDSNRMWQIGINVLPEVRTEGIGAMLVALLKNEILGMGRLPFYGTSMSHIASQRLALRACFYPAWS